MFNQKEVGKFRVDFLIDDKVILEVKSVEGRLPKIFESQVISYLKASNLDVGLLVNFGNRSCEVRRLMTSPKNRCNLNLNLCNPKINHFNKKEHK